MWRLAAPLSSSGMMTRFRDDGIAAAEADRATSALLLNGPGFRRLPEKRARPIRPTRSLWQCRSRFSRPRTYRSRHHGHHEAKSPAHLCGGSWFPGSWRILPGMGAVDALAVICGECVGGCGPVRAGTPRTTTSANAPVSGGVRISPSSLRSMRVLCGLTSWLAGESRLCGQLLIFLFRGEEP